MQREMTSTVSVVMATYNRAMYIAEAIDSLLGQTVQADEIIVVDDGSTDETPAIVRAYRERVRYVHKPNGGKSTALNLALSLTSADWIWFFDDDDVALPDSLAVRLAAIAQRPDADVVYSGQIVGMNGPDNRIIPGHSVPAPQFSDDNILLGVLKEYPFRLQGMLIRKKLLKEIGGFDESYLRSQDYELYIRMFQQCKAVGICEPTFIWRNHLGPRGPRKLAHDGSLRDVVWREYDGKLGRSVRERFQLGMFLAPPKATEELPAPLRRKALYNRMEVMASKGLLAEMLTDLEQASCAHASSLSPEERRTCIQSTLSPYFVAALQIDSGTFLATLSRLHNDISLQSIGYFARGLWYAARNAQRPPTERWRLTVIAARLALIAGPRSILSAYMQK